ncbi:hypothetical protein AGMMS50284_7120 [Clostridia bacterium]|nr:hypothetical protein AGMMS50284_7120 [Clostridia bacterium]
MKHIQADDGRILTPPKELKPLLKGAFPAFIALLGHIRFFYVADELWDGKASLIFQNGSNRLAAVKLDDGAFRVHIADKDFRVIDESLLDTIYEALQNAATENMRRPKEQLSVNLDEYPNGVRCDLCQLYKGNNINALSGCEDFRIMDHHCYYGVEEGWGERKNSVDSSWICGGLQGCYAKTFACLEVKGVKNCFECGEYRTCEDCGVGHTPGQCNLGITAEEVTKLIIPYCEVERLDYWKMEMKNDE